MALLLTLTVARAWAAEAPAPDPFPTEPLLRLDPGGHPSMINRIDVDAAERWVVSGSDDKTVRVWRLADGAPERTLRVPAGPGDLGKVFAVAISPAGGWWRSGVGLDRRTGYTGTSTFSPAPTAG